MIDEQLVPITVVEPKNDNGICRDIDKRQYQVKGDPQKIIKWFRNNCGERGIGWDFMGSGKKVTVFVYSSKVATMYEMWHN